MTLSVPFLYLVGYFYQLGYMEPFNVSNDLFTKSIDGYLVNSFYAFMILTMQLMSLWSKNKFLFIILGITCSIFSVLVVYSDKRQQQIDKVINKVTGLKYYEYLSKAIFFGLLGFIAPFGIILLMGFFILIPLGAYQGGIYEAQKIIKSYEECDIKALKHEEKCTLVYDDGEMKLIGFLIASSDKHIAIYDGEKSIIYPTNDSIMKFYKGQKQVKSNE